tara:strand:- start:549 stop:953 length:405 start_codon:yes stop_codon:yes gene_type:complete
MLLVIAGSREAREHHVREAIYRCPWKNKITKVISGTAHGADKYGEKYAKENDIEIIRFPADWDQYGMSAGPRRNKEMAQNADALLAIWNGSSRGTESMLFYARKYGLKTMIYFYNQNRIEFWNKNVENQMELAI